MRGLVQALRPAGLPVSRRTGVRPAPPTGYGCWQAGYDERRVPDHRGGAESRRWCPTGHYQPCSLICSQPSSMAFSIASASSAERLPAVWLRIAWRSSSLIRLSRCTKSAATSSLSGGSVFRSSTMFSRGLTTLTVHRHDRPGKQQQQGCPVLKEPAIPATAPDDGLRGGGSRRPALRVSRRGVRR